ncbi:hypothetical protein [Achromobacter kerstersii]|uniref:hypothetical protein n=1 Tax=Achromobacter kerstersii TaxID=1353890 RepID=UPI00313F1AD0
MVERRSHGWGTDDFAIYSSAQPYACFNDGETRLRFARNVLCFARYVLCFARNVLRFVRNVLRFVRNVLRRRGRPGGLRDRLARRPARSLGARACEIAWRSGLGDCPEIGQFLISGGRKLYSQE